MKRVIHIHVPRTAGDSMRSWARRGPFTYQELYKINSRFKKKTFDWNPSTDWTYLGHSSPGGLIEDGTITRGWYLRCFRFAFVRNPWDRLVSVYECLRSEPRRTRRREWSHLSSFDSFVKCTVLGTSDVTPRFRYRQLPWLKGGMDFIGRYGRLDEDWKKLCTAVGVKYRPLKRRGIRTSKDGRDFRRCYNRVLRELVATFYAEEIERFGFKFEEDQ